MLGKIDRFCNYILLTGSNTGVDTNFSQHKMGSISNTIACFHFTVFFALEEMVSIDINFMATSAFDARCNDWEVKFSFKHQLEIMTGKAKISKSLGSVEESLTGVMHHDGWQCRG